MITGTFTNLNEKTTKTDIDIDYVSKLITESKQANQIILITPDGMLYRGHPSQLMKVFMTEFEKENMQT